MLNAQEAHHFEGNLELSTCWMSVEVEAESAGSSVEVVIADAEFLGQVRQENPVTQSVAQGPDVRDQTSESRAHRCRIPSRPWTITHLSVPSRIHRLAVVGAIRSSDATRCVSQSGSSVLSGSIIQPAAPSVAST